MSRARFDLLREPLEPSKHARQQYHVCVTTFAKQGLDFALTLFLTGGEVRGAESGTRVQTRRDAAGRSTAEQQHG